MNNKAPDENLGFIVKPSTIDDLAKQQKHMDDILAECSCPKLCINYVFNKIDYGFKEGCKLDCEGYAECNNYVPQYVYFKKDEWKE